MTSSRSLTLARLTELSQTIEYSSKILRGFLEQDEKTSTKGGESDPAAELAKSLGLPFQTNLQLVEQASVLRVACERLARLVTPPRHIAYESAGSYFTTVALEIALKYDIATFIHKMSQTDNREGIPVEELALQFELDADTLGRLLRYLSVRGIFQEIEPDTFANTTASSVLVNNPDLAAHLNGLMREVRKGAEFYEEYMKRRRRERNQPTPEPFVLYSGMPWYSWLHSEENAERGKLFNLAMRGMNKSEGLQSIPFDYPFHSMAPDTLVVDAGGGVGSLAELVLPSASHIRFVVEDLEEVIAYAQDVASPAMKEWMAEGRVKFRVHDFFVRQPAEYQGAIFVLKSVLHNWTDAKAADLLCTLRESNPSKLLVIDRMVRRHLRTEAQTEVGESEIYQAWREIGSEGQRTTISSQSVPTAYDFSMSVLFGSKDRLHEEWEALLSRAGYKLTGVYPLRGSTGQVVLEAVPMC